MHAAVSFCRFAEDPDPEVALRDLPAAFRLADGREELEARATCCHDAAPGAVACPGRGCNGVSRLMAKRMFQWMLPMMEETRVVVVNGTTKSKQFDVEEPSIQRRRS